MSARTEMLSDMLAYLVPLRIEEIRHSGIDLQDALDRAQGGVRAQLREEPHADK